MLCTSSHHGLIQLLLSALSACPGLEKSYWIARRYATPFPSLLKVNKYGTVPTFQCTGSWGNLKRVLTWYFQFAIFSFSFQLKAQAQWTYKRNTSKDRRTLNDLLLYLFLLTNLCFSPWKVNVSWHRSTLVCSVPLIAATTTHERSQKKCLQPAPLLIFLSAAPIDSVLQEICKFCSAMISC